MDGIHDMGGMHGFGKVEPAQPRHERDRSVDD
jgi:Nitrile hydratase beta subunit